MNLPPPSQTSASKHAYQQAKKPNNRYGNMPSDAPKPPQLKSARGGVQPPKIEQVNQRVETQVDDVDDAAYGISGSPNQMEKFQIEGKVENVNEEDPSFLDEDTSIAQEYAVTEQNPAELQESIPKD